MAATTIHANSFRDLHLSRPLLMACDEALGYSEPTPIQAACIPLALTGRDIFVSGVTGPEKTTAFALPTLERLSFRPNNMPAFRVLILTPTSESADQIHGMIGELARFMPDIRCLSTEEQGSSLTSLPVPDIVVATPGSMLHQLCDSTSVHLDEVAVLIFDEADKLFQLGFSAEIDELLNLCPTRRQTMLFSATMTEEVDELIERSMKEPVCLLADP